MEGGLGGVAEIREHKLGTMHKHKHKLGTMQGVHLTSPLVSANVHNTIWHTAHCTWHTSHFTLNTEGTLDAAAPLPLNMTHCTLNAEQCKNALLQKLVLTSLCRLYFYLAVHDIGHRS